MIENREETKMTQAVTRNQTIHCNRCNATFEAPKDMERDGFYGTKAARIRQFCLCPHCGQSDSHWVYAADIPMPTFEGGFDARKKAERQWLREN